MIDQKFGIAHFFRALYFLFEFSLFLGKLYGRKALERLRLFSPNETKKAEYLYDLLERLGPTFTKGGQMLSSRPDIVGKEMATKLGELCDKVKPVPNLLPIIKARYQEPFDSLFKSIEPEPIAAGSISQVHKVRLKDDTEIVLKVRRPGIKKIIEKDLVILLALAKLIQKSPFGKKIPIYLVVKELGKEILEQVDFKKEIRNHQKLKKVIERKNVIKIPELYLEYCTSGIIAMEYIPEMRTAQNVGISSKQREILSRAGLEVVCKMLFEEGLTHSDLHPGNVYFLESGEMVILDFGLVTAITEQAKGKFWWFFFHIAVNNGDECGKIALETAISKPEDLDEELFLKEMKELVDGFSGKPVEEFEVADFVMEVFNMQRKFGILSSTLFTMCIITLLGLEGILKILDANLDFQREMVDLMIVVE